MSRLATACPDISEVCRLVRRSAIHYIYAFESAYKLLVEDKNMLSGLVGEMARWLPDFMNYLSGVVARTIGQERRDTAFFFGSTMPILQQRSLPKFGQWKLI